MTYILISVFKLWGEKCSHIQQQKLVDPGAFGSVVRWLPIKLFKNVPSSEYDVYIKKESALYGPWENFILNFIEFLCKPSEHKMIYFVR